MMMSQWRHKTAQFSEIFVNKINFIEQSNILLRILHKVKQIFAKSKYFKVINVSDINDFENSLILSTRLK